MNALIKNKIKFQTGQWLPAIPPASRFNMGAASKATPFQPWELRSFSAKATVPPEMRPAFNSVSGIALRPLNTLCIVVTPTIFGESQKSID